MLPLGNLRPTETPTEETAPFTARRMSCRYSRSRNEIRCDCSSVIGVDLRERIQNLLATTIVEADVLKLG